MLQEFRQSIAQQIELAVRMHEKMGFPAESLEVLKERAPHMIEMVLQLLPALVFLSLAFMVLLNIMFLCRRFPERRAQWLSLTNLREWKGPEPLVWILIACGFSLFIPGLEPAHAAALNLLLIIGSCYFAQGLAVIAFFFIRTRFRGFCALLLMC